MLHFKLIHIDIPHLIIIVQIQIVSVVERMSTLRMLWLLQGGCGRRNRSTKLPLLPRRTASSSSSRSRLLLLLNTVSGCRTRSWKECLTAVREGGRRQATEHRPCPLQQLRHGRWSRQRESCIHIYLLLLLHQL